MAPHNQSNTIDFDAAKLQRLGYASRAQKTLKPVSLAQLRQQQPEAGGAVFRSLRDELPPHY